MHEHYHRQERSGRRCKSDHLIVQGQPFLSLRERLLNSYLKGNAGKGKYVTFCRPPELLASVKEFRSHPSWGAHSNSRIGRRHVSKVSKSEVSNFRFPVAANKYVLLDKHNRQSPRICWWKLLTPFKSPWHIPCECRC
jgi:hypothetical protein